MKDVIESMDNKVGLSIIIIYDYLFFKNIIEYNQFDERNKIEFYLILKIIQWRNDIFQICSLNKPLASIWFVDTILANQPPNSIGKL